jgi:hypothetical protein
VERKMSALSDFNKVIYEQIKNNISEEFFDESKDYIISFCSGLNEITSNKEKLKFIKKLNSLKQYFIEKGLTYDEVNFIDEEISIHSGVNLSLEHIDENEIIERKTIEDYSRVENTKEGLFKIEKKYNYLQLKRLTEGLFRKTKMLKFFISNKDEVVGKINCEIYEHPQKIPLLRLFKSIKIDSNTGLPNYKILLFGDQMSGPTYSLIKEVNFPFYFYRFITKENQEMILVSEKRLTIGDYIVKGVTLQCNDKKSLTDSAKLTTKLPFFFVYDIKNRIINFKDHEEFSKFIKKLGITKENFFYYPMSIKSKTSNKNLKLVAPTWYKWLLWSFLTHQKKGIDESYPMHLMVVGPPDTGKSLGLRCLGQKLNETKTIFSGNNSTIKNIVPSFATNPAKIGYLCECSRFALLDEFLGCISRTRSSNVGVTDGVLPFLNDILEHKTRDVGSGNSSVKVKMSARSFFATNPPFPMNVNCNLNGFLKKYEESFLTRLLIYFQTEGHIAMIKKAGEGILEDTSFTIRNNDFLSIIDYLNSFSSNYDLKRVREIYDNTDGLLSGDLLRFYKSRQRHHIECLIDGIIKTRCFLNNDMVFEAKEEDYKILEDIWINIITSWIQNLNIEKIPLKYRLNFMPEKAQYIYEKLFEYKKPVSRDDLKKILLNDINNREFIEFWGLLTQNGLILEKEGYVATYENSKLIGGIK